MAAAQPSVHELSTTISPSPASASSYNDVFFQRRAETVTSVSPAAVVPELAAPEPAPAPVTIAPMEPPAPEAEQHAAVTSAPEPTPEPTPEPALRQAPVAAAAAAEPAPVPVVAESSPPVQGQPDEQKGGFFSRIFGKLRK